MEVVKREHIAPVAIAANEWTRERLDLVKRTVCPQGIPDTEFALFVEQCKRSGLDPLIKQAFCVKRRQNIGSRQNPKWIDKFEFQPAEAGMLARAEAFPDFRGITAAAVHANDTIEIDPGAGTVSHRFTPGPNRGAVIGAWAKVERVDRTPVVVWLNLGDYVQDSPMWKRLEATMIAKCARVAALRVAYPSAFGGLYIREEMPAEEFDHAPPQREQMRPPAPVQSVAELPAQTSTDAEFVPEVEAAADDEDQPETWIARINGASSEAELAEIGKQLGQRFHKGHPTRAAINGAYASKNAALRRTA